MLTMHLFSSNIKPQVNLPFQWLKLTFYIVRLNSTSSNSSSDSDSDTEHSVENKFINKNDNAKDKDIKHVDYLHAASIRQTKIKIENELRKASTKLLNTVAEKDKEKIFSNTLSTISHMQNNHPSYKRTSYGKKHLMVEESSSIQTQPCNIRNGENQYMSVIRTLQNEKQKTTDTKNQLKNMENQFRAKYEMKEHSVIRALQSEQRKTWSSENQFRINHKKEEEPSVIRVLQKQQQKTKNIDNQFRVKYEIEEEPSVIKTLRRQQQNRMNIENQSKGEYKTEKEPSVIQTLQNQQQKKIENQFGTKHIIGNRFNKTREIKGKRYETPVEYENIFVNQFTETLAVLELKTWNKCEENNLQNSKIRYPKNAFEEMIKWTQDGILWQFPINNEQGMEEEKDVHFSKHVFLEQHLTGWCPAKGPIRHFMELVCIGLSKNPYMTVKEKLDHIMWYKDYFESKQDLLQKLGLTE